MPAVQRSREKWPGEKVATEDHRGCSAEVCRENFAKRATFFPSKSDGRKFGGSRLGGARGTGIQHSPPRNTREPTGADDLRHAATARGTAAMARRQARNTRRFILSPPLLVGLRDRRCETLTGDGLRKTPPAHGRPCCRSGAGHRSCNRCPILSPSPRTRARDSVDSPPPCARRC
jgi:hypothetical protein